MLNLNTRYTITAPQGTITATGVRLINEHIARQSLTSDAWREKNPAPTHNRLPALPETWAWVWTVTGRGEYVGTFTKRVSKFYYKAHGIKCPAAFVQEIGNIARSHTEDNLSYDFEFVNEFDWQAGDFGDNGSCFWGSNEAAREVMANEGGLAIRFYASNGNGQARAWVAPIERGLYIVFNGYGFNSHPTLVAARVLSLHLNSSYKKVYLSNHGQESGLVYINSGIGYIVGNADKIDSYSEYDLQWGTDNYCNDCGDEIHGDAHYGPDGEAYCETCFYDRYEYCEHCGETVDRDDIYIVDNRRYTEYLCERCYERHCTRCDVCDEDVLHNNSVTVGDTTYCDNCAPPIQGPQPAN